MASPARPDTRPTRARPRGAGRPPVRPPAPRAPGRPRRPLGPRHPRFVPDVLAPLADRARAGEDGRQLAEELYERVVHPWAMAQAKAQAVGLPAHADRNEVLSQVLRLAWEACLKIDWERIESWPALLEGKVTHARIEAARAEDWLSRRERVYRRRYQRAVAELEQSSGRPLSHAERLRVAAQVAPPSNRVDWARELVAAKHPSTVAELPEGPARSDVADEVEERLMHRERARRLEEWLTALAAEDQRLADDLGRWRDSSDDQSRDLPARLARRVEPYAPLLVGLLLED
jgi:hypothetical protein